MDGPAASDSSWLEVDGALSRVTHPFPSCCLTAGAYRVAGTEDGRKSRASGSLATWLQHVLQSGFGCG